MLIADAEVVEMGLFSTLGNIAGLGPAQGLVNKARGRNVSTASLLGFGLFEGAIPKFPEVPVVRTPPPPTRSPAPPRRTDPAIQAAGANQRGLFRRRGRQTTVLTPGRGAGVGTGTGTRSVLGETIA